jgi:hypothetical protein
MGVDVVLMKVSRAGTSPRRRKVTPVGASLTDLDDVLVRLVDRLRGCGQAPMLERIDPYGDLILTPVEMPQLLQEVARIRGLAVTAVEREVLTRLEQLLPGAGTMTRPRFTSRVIEHCG